MVFNNLFKTKSRIKTENQLNTEYEFTIEHDWKMQHDYSDPSKTNEEKIRLEKRRRHQIYMLLDYALAAVSSTDFFSSDTFRIARQAKTLAQCTKAKFLTSEFLLIPFFDSELELSSILKEENLDENEIGKMISSSNKLTPRSFKEKVLFFFTRPFKNRRTIEFFRKRFTNSNVKYSYGVNKLFDQTAENALSRFKTPVITPEILLITMMEAKNDNVGKIIKTFFKNDLDWHIFRYRLIKRIHAQETSIRSGVKKSKHLFAYLLKVNLTESEFNRLVELELVDFGASTFRNKVIRYMLSVDMFELLEYDTYQSIKATSTRKYSE
jgi:hypothetical protein